MLLVEPEHAGVHYVRGRLHAADGEYQQAIDLFTWLIESGDESHYWPFFWEDHAYIDRSLAYQAIGQMNLALDDLNALVDLYPGWYVAHYHRGRLHAVLGMVDQAQDDFSIALENAPDDVWVDLIEEELDAL